MKRKAFRKNSQQCFVGAYNSQLTFILSSFRGIHYSKYFTLLCAVFCLPTIQPNTIPLEAAFQGKYLKRRCSIWIHLFVFLCVCPFSSNVLVERANLLIVLLGAFICSL